MAEEIDFENRHNRYPRTKLLSSESRGGHVSRDIRDLRYGSNTILVALSIDTIRLSLVISVGE